MKPIFTQEQACNILNGNYTRLNTDKECTISKAMFAEAVENMEIPADVSNGNDLVAAVLNKAARTEEAISKNILYSGLKANSTNTTWAPFNGYSYTNLNDNKTPNLDSLNDVLEKLDSSIFSGVSGTSTTYTVSSDEAVKTLHKTFIETLKTIGDQEELIYDNIFPKTNKNDEDQESLGIKAYTYFRGGSAIVRATIDPEKNSKLYQDIKGDVPNIVNAYSTPFRKAVAAFQSITNKLNREAVAPTQQQADQLKYAAEKLSKAIACYVSCYLSKANVIYAAKADAIAEFLNAKDAYALADQNITEKPEPMDKDSIFESFDFDDEFGIGMMDDEEEPIYALESSAIECEYEYLTKELLLQEAVDKFYATYFDDAKLAYKEDMQQMAQQAANKFKQAYNDKGNLATRFRKIWAQFEQFLQNIFAKFKTSMETRIKDMQAYIAQNEQTIRTNGQNSNAIATFGDYKQGLKNIQNVTLPDINQLVANAEKGTIASVEDIQTQVKGFSHPFTPGGDNNFTEFCKIQFYGTTNGKVDHPVKNIVGDAIEFCKDFKGYSDLIDKQTKDVSAVEKLISDKLDKLTQVDKQQDSQQGNQQQQQLPPGQPQQGQSAQPQQQAQQPAQQQSQPQQTSQHNSVTYEDIKNYIQSYLEADQKDDGPGMSIKTPDGKAVTSGEGNATSDPEKKAANAISTLAINYQNVMRSVHTAKITAYERIYADYSKLLKSLGNGVEQPQGQNGTQPVQNQPQQQPAQ